MRTHSIDLLAEDIKNSKTKEYFKEVVSSYYSDNYRSALVMLNSVVICDLIYKLQELKEQFSDQNAKNILDEIERIQNANPVSSDWENKLIELVKAQTKILEHSDYQNILHLQKHRHLCAHPVLLQNYELYSPNKETVRAHIVNILGGLLTKPALLSKKILNDFLKNLSDIKNILIAEKDIETHLKSKYFDNLNFNIEQDIFKSLWKIIFQLDNPLCNENREINFKTLKIILNRNYSGILSFIEAEKVYFSNNLNFDYFELILSFFNENPSIYSKLNDSAKTLIKRTIDNNNNYLFKAFFLKKSVIEHLDCLYKIDNSVYYQSILANSVIELYYTCLNQGLNTEGKDLLITMFSKSHDFDQADVRYERLIEPFLDEFSIDEFKKIMTGINENGQINGRRKASSSNRQIKRVIEDLDETFDFSIYTNFED